MLKPNMQLALASSYNERGRAGFTNTVTNRIDQQKINLMYDVTKNAITGAGKVDLVKRPGVSRNSNFFGVSSQAAYLICLIPFGDQNSDLTSSQDRLVFSQDGNILQSSNSASIVSAGGSVTIISVSAGLALLPIYVDYTNLSGSSNVVLQTAAPATTPIYQTQAVFFSTTGLSWTRIVDADFPTKLQGKMEHMDGYAFQLNQNNLIYNSDLNSLANWTATSFISKQIHEDFPVGLARLNNQIIAFCNETVEMFYNAGNATGSPLSPIKQLHQRIGCIHNFNGGGQTHYYCTIQGRIYFVGRTTGGRFSLGAFAYNGAIFEKISTPAIDRIFTEVGANGVFAVVAMGISGQQAVAITLTAPTASTQRWLMYFPEWKDWFEWNSTTFFPSTDSTYVLGVTPNQNRIYNFLAVDNWQDNSVSFTASTQFKLPQDGHQRKRMAEFGVLADTARASNQLLVEFSDDDYQSFYTVGNIELQRDIKTLNRGGSYRQRAVRLSSTNALETRLSAFVARIE